MVPRRHCQADSGTAGRKKGCLPPPPKNRYRDRHAASTLHRHDAHRRGGLRMQLEGPTAAGLMYSDTGGTGRWWCCGTGC